jgi:hypothetical protein
MGAGAQAYNVQGCWCVGGRISASSERADSYTIQNYLDSCSEEGGTTGEKVPYVQADRTFVV